MIGSPAILVDTSVFIDHLRLKDKGKSKLNDIVQLYRRPLATSIMTLAELYSGSSVWQNDKNKQQLEKLLFGVEVLGIERNIAVEAGRLRSAYTIGVVDSIIGATALHWGCSIATLDIADFKKIPGIDLLEF